MGVDCELMNVPRFAAFSLSSARVRLSFNDKETLIFVFIYCKNKSLAVERERFSPFALSLPLARFDCDLFVWIKLRGFFHFDYTSLAHLCFQCRSVKPQNPALKRLIARPSSFATVYLSVWDFIIRF
jgi:hypothetical protein